ncbi:MAG: Sulphatase-modifying factor protein [Bacteroidota bacterium]|nr:Sulphatase-modifying factor protein [Bacteroidota bacterium]
MKKITLLVFVLFFVTGLFAQSKTATSPRDTSLAHKHAPKRENNVASNVPMEILVNIEANMVNVSGGSITMGCDNPQDTDCYYWEKPAHMITVSNFYISKYPVTQRQWEAIVGINPFSSKYCPDCPVENVSWYDTQIFFSKLNQMTGKEYRLPTEAEWEYAAKGGAKTKEFKYAGSNNPDEVGWNGNNSNKQTHPVGTKKPNELGLYDMSGNVWQWCSDWFNEKYYTKSPVLNPEGPKRAEYRVCRGGSWWSDPADTRTINRDRYPADARDDDVGFRIARDN